MPGTDINKSRYSAHVLRQNDSTGERYRLGLTSNTKDLHIRRIMLLVTEALTAGIGNAYYGYGVAEGDTVVVVSLDLCGGVSGGVSVDPVGLLRGGGAPTSDAAVVVTASTSDLTPDDTAVLMMELPLYEGSGVTDLRWDNGEFVLTDGQSLLFQVSADDSVVSIYVEWCEGE